MHGHPEGGLGRGLSDGIAQIYAVELVHLARLHCMVSTLLLRASFALRM